MSNATPESITSKVGARISMLGALLVALNIGFGVMGYIVMTAASGLLGHWAWKSGQKAQFQMYATFITVNLIGVVRHLAQ